MNVRLFLAFAFVLTCLCLANATDDWAQALPFLKQHYSEVDLNALRDYVRSIVKNPTAIVKQGRLTILG